MDKHEKRCLEKLRKGDASAFKQVYLDHYPGLLRYATMHLLVKENAEEIVQELFLKIWNNHTELNIKSSLKAYLFSSVRNACLNQIKHEIIKRKYTSEFLAESREQKVSFSEDILINELQQMIDEAIDSLPERQREVFIMHRQNNLKYHEIAIKLGISQKTVQAHMSKALRLLKESLKSIYSVLLFFC